jgi:hypothetical protein
MHDANGNTQKKTEPWHSTPLISVYNIIYHPLQKPPANTAGLSSSKFYSPSKLDAPPSDPESALLCCILVRKSISFWYLQCLLLTKMLQVWVRRTLTSSCFGFACARAQGTRHRRRRQVPCPLSKMIGRNHLQGFKHSFNQKKCAGVKTTKVH